MVRLVLTLIVVLVLPAAADAQRKQSGATAAAPRTLRDCSSCPQMVVVPAGEFLMGSPETERNRGKDEGPQRKIIISKPFAVGKFEITFAEWDACQADGGCPAQPLDEGWGRGRHPVINVTWVDAGQYAAWLSSKTGKSYRLLSEAEWEYAARAGTVTPFSFGETINYGQSNYDANFVYNGGHGGIYRQKTMDAGSFKANAFGLNDMHGNVWEWVGDCYKDTYKDAPTDGSPVIAPDCKLHVLRGGSWNYHPKALRSAYRYATPPDIRLNNAGFRIARDL